MLVTWGEIGTPTSLVGMTVARTMLTVFVDSMCVPYYAAFLLLGICPKAVPFICFLQTLLENIFYMR